MATTLLPCQFCSSQSNSKLPKPPSKHIGLSTCWPRRLLRPSCSLRGSHQKQSQQKGKAFSLKECAISVALAVGLVTGVPALGWSPYANATASTDPALPDVSVLISGPPIKDPGALLRYALPVDNKAIREVGKPLEDITDSLKNAGVKALDSVEKVKHLRPSPFPSRGIRMSLCCGFHKDILCKECGSELCFRDLMFKYLMRCYVDAGIAESEGGISIP